MSGPVPTASATETSDRKPRCPLAGPAPHAHSRTKRTLDVALSAALLVALLPLMALVALLVALSSPGPVIYRQNRLGLGGHPFAVLKFRSMYRDSVAMADLLRAEGRELSLCHDLRHDPRVTAVGRFLRKTSLDELPQLVNVLRGDMSLVGPRPAPDAESATLRQEDRARRLSVKPGMTGLWQVSGRRSLSSEETIRLDLQYVDCWTLRLDLLILLRTLPAVLRTRDAR